jgi:hypothetical protein
MYYYALCTLLMMAATYVAYRSGLMRSCFDLFRGSRSRRNPKRLSERRSSALKSWVVEQPEVVVPEEAPAELGEAEPPEKPQPASLVSTAWRRPEPVPIDRAAILARIDALIADSRSYRPARPSRKPPKSATAETTATSAILRSA